jgi:hypothetical protein
VEAMSLLRKYFPLPQNLTFYGAADRTPIENGHPPGRSLNLYGREKPPGMAERLIQQSLLHDLIQDGRCALGGETVP